MVYYGYGVRCKPSRYVFRHVHPNGCWVGAPRRKAAHSGSNMPNVGRDRPAMEASTALAAVIRSRLNRFVPPLTVDELADRSGSISRSTLQTRMNKNRAKALAFYVEEVWAIADVLGVAPHVLFEEAEDLRASGQCAEPTACSPTLPDQAARGVTREDRPATYSALQPIHPRESMSHQSLCRRGRRPTDRRRPGLRIQQHHCPGRPAPDDRGLVRVGLQVRHPGSRPPGRGELFQPGAACRTAIFDACESAQGGKSATAWILIGLGAVAAAGGLLVRRPESARA